MKKPAILLFLSMLLSGCSSIPEPVDHSSTLFIGKIVLAAKGYEGYGHVSVNGVHKMGIYFIIRNIETGEKYEFISGSTGMFHSLNIPEGEYRIEKCFYQYRSENSGVSIGAGMDEHNVFRITPGKVNNIGVIYWFASRGEGMSILFNMDYYAVYDDFSKKHKNSLWLGYEWVNISIDKQSNPINSPVMHLTKLSSDKAIF